MTDTPLVTISKIFAPDSAVDPYDTRKIKQALNRLGYYSPLPSTGITNIPDRAIFDSIKLFQDSNNLPATGIIRPADKTLMAINAAIENQPPNARYIWCTKMDHKVRATHAAHEGEIFFWNNPPAETGHPGEDEECRCWAEEIEDEPLIPEDAINPVYPELYLLPILSLGKLKFAWKKIPINIGRDTEWSLGKFKSEKRWENQFKNRNWTAKDITDTLKKGTKHPAPNNPNPNNPATRYEYKGRYLVRDEKTKEILQIGSRDFHRLIKKTGDKP